MGSLHAEQGSRKPSGGSGARAAPNNYKISMRAAKIKSRRLKLPRTWRLYNPLLVALGCIAMPPPIGKTLHHLARSIVRLRENATRMGISGRRGAYKGGAAVPLLNGALLSQAELQLDIFLITRTLRQGSEQETTVYK
jgi:hypothetical protein